MELLFESRREIVGRRGRLTAIQATASVSAEPVLKPDTETDGGGVALYGSVLRESDRFRMWYQAAPASHTWDRDFSYVGYAESEDGINWRKPDLSREAAADLPPGNITNLGLHSPSIMKTPEGYLASGCWKRSLGGNPAATGPGYYLASSQDGLDWRLVTPTPSLPGGDVITSIWDERFQRGETACKYLRYHGGIQRRALFLAELETGGWSEPRLALMPGDADDSAALARGYRSADYYGVTWLPSGAVGMTGLVWMFYHQPPYFRSGAGMFGGAALVPAYREAPGSAWVMPVGRKPFLEHPAGWESGRFFYAASSVLTCGDEQWLYCTAFHHGHGFTLNEERKREPAAVELLQKKGLANIHLAKWKRDRIFGFRAETEAELLLQTKVPPQGGKLSLNYRTEAGGWITVRISKAGPGDFVPGFTQAPTEAEAGFDFTDCIPLTGDSCQAGVTWKAGNNLPGGNADDTWIITLRMFMAECYAYEISHE